MEKCLDFWEVPMIDLHCHIIPWVDDGAANSTVACAMAQRAWAEGVTTVVATPHCNLDDRQPNFLGRGYARTFALFRALLRQHKIPLEILPGAELFCHPSNLRYLLDRQKVATLNHSRYLLVEFNFSEGGGAMTDALELISRRGLVPVVAHPERYECVQFQPELVAEWFRRGYIIQLNKGSIMGQLGAEPKETAGLLLERGLAHVVASDAHNTRHRRTGFQSLIPILERRCTREYIDLLLKGNPQAVIEDRPIIPESFR